MPPRHYKVKQQRTFSAFGSSERETPRVLSFPYGYWEDSEIHNGVGEVSMCAFGDDPTAFFLRVDAISEEAAVSAWVKLSAILRKVGSLIP